MEHAAQLLAAFLPALIVLAYGVTKTSGEWLNEALWVAFFVSLVVAVPIVGAEWLLVQTLDDNLDPISKALTHSSVAGTVEEAGKYMVLVCIAEKHVDARRRQDIILLALGCSLGFAAIENFIYILGSKSWTFTAYSRSVTAVLGHGLLGLLMGALLTAGRLRGPHSMMPLLALWIPIVAHIAYDFPPMLVAADPSKAIVLLGSGLI